MFRNQDRGQACDCDSQSGVNRFYEDRGNIRGLRPGRPRAQTSALLGRFNLDVAELNRAACFHDLGGANVAEDAINRTHVVSNCAGKTGDPYYLRSGHITRGLAVLLTFSRLTLSKKVGSGL